MKTPVMGGTILIQKANYLHAQFLTSTANAPAAVSPKTSERQQLNGLRALPLHAKPILPVRTQHHSASASPAPGRGADLPNPTAHPITRGRSQPPAENCEFRSSDHPFSLEKSARA